MNTAIDGLLPGRSKAAVELRSRVTLAARADVPVLIRGEIGAGKEYVARAIHTASSRAHKPFVIANLATLTPGLATAELFGHARGAFTGALREKAGLFEMAHSGTVFLDDLSTAPLEIQLLLLRVIDTGEVKRVGAISPTQVNVRFIAAVTIDETGDVQGNVRRDLLYRLAGLDITVPPLRSRAADIDELALHILRRRTGGEDKFSLAPAAAQRLRNYEFPGNFRELESLLTQASLSAATQEITPKDLPLTRSRAKRRSDKAESETLRRELEAARRELDAYRVRSIVADPIWQGRGFPIEPGYAFVLMPFADVRDVQSVYLNHVKPVIERAGLHCERADDIYDISGVMQSVWEGINRARVVIADLTERNPNVFYELGIAHTLGKAVVMLTQDIDFVPFDLRHLRCVVYAYTPPGAVALEVALERTLERVLSATQRPHIAAVPDADRAGA